MKKLKPDRRYCAQPDVDAPKLECGHPLPCPRHTLILDPRQGTVGVPANVIVGPVTQARLHEVLDAIEDDP